MTLKIISAQSILFQGEAALVTLPGEQGLFTVLPRHASLVSTLVEGDIVYRTSEGGGDIRTHVQGGLADIDHDSNTVSVCVY